MKKQIAENRLQGQWQNLAVVCNGSENMLTYDKKDKDWDVTIGQVCEYFSISKGCYSKHQNRVKISPVFGFS